MKTALSVVNTTEISLTDNYWTWSTFRQTVTHRHLEWNDAVVTSRLQQQQRRRRGLTADLRYTSERSPTALRAVPSVRPSVQPLITLLSSERCHVRPLHSPPRSVLPFGKTAT